LLFGIDRNPDLLGLNENQRKSGELRNSNFTNASIQAKKFHPLESGDCPQTAQFLNSRASLPSPAQCRDGVRKAQPVVKARRATAASQPLATGRMASLKS
jgi:hypothetical protein